MFVEANKQRYALADPGHSNVFTTLRIDPVFFHGSFAPG